MANETAHRLAPKIVTEELQDWRGRSEVLIVTHGKYVIVDQFSIQTVEVAGDREEKGGQMSGHVHRIEREQHLDY